MQHDNVGDRESRRTSELDDKRRSAYRWSLAILGLATVVTFAFAWRKLYRFNQRELVLQRKLQMDRSLAAALAEVPGRRFTVMDVNPEALRKSALIT
ncbi:hypothetical protein DPX39_110123400 [Trypanosoma brucei equiperdum]|uniref:Uncharacterized protein n=1 Tax=Trypanosoma brucei equiperdum TaxID=630700 RepID=A0A3L6KU26_9TRYP|nr:hypothetical protein DPX39_110123400 [Trypanosoma brucei equiperdum]